MHHIYCISGLGADHRIFQKLYIPGAELHFIHWEMPLPEDSMQSYALRLSSQIKHREIILLGVSFGGMLAAELNNVFSKSNNPGESPSFTILKTILVSSCKTPSEFPSLLRLSGGIKLHKAIPYRFVLRNNRLNRFLFDLRSEEEELYLKRLMLMHNDVTIIKRSINIILTWKSSPGQPVVHIHGTSDRLLLPGKVKADYWIEGGGHFMVWNRADEISRLVAEIIDQ